MTAIPPVRDIRAFLMATLDMRPNCGLGRRVARFAALGSGSENWLAGVLLLLVATGWDGSHSASHAQAAWDGRGAPPTAGVPGAIRKPTHRPRDPRLKAADTSNADALAAYSPAWW